MQAEARARLAADIVRKRIGNTLTLRVDLIGSISILADDAGAMLAVQVCGQARDVRLHIAASHAERGMA